MAQPKNFTVTNTETKQSMVVHEQSRPRAVARAAAAGLGAAGLLEATLAADQTWRRRATRPKAAPVAAAEPAVVLPEPSGAARKRGNLTPYVVIDGKGDVVAAFGRKSREKAEAAARVPGLFLFLAAEKRVEVVR